MVTFCSATLLSYGVVSLSDLCQVLRVDAEMVPLLASEGAALQQLPGVGLYYCSEIHGVPHTLTRMVCTLSLISAHV